MKKLFLLITSCCILHIGQAQSVTAYNPLVQNLHFTPEPNQFGFQNCSETVAKFNFGLTTQANADQFATQPLKINVCLQGFFLAHINPTYSVSGPQAAYFTWTYDVLTNCLQGVQKSTLYGTGTNIFNLDPRSLGEIAINLSILPYLPVPATLQADVTLDIPSYMQVGNAPDDQESSATQNYIGVTTASGILYLDSVSSATPTGLANGRPDGTPMYINIIDDNTGLVEDHALIDSNGNYFVDSLRPERAYTITLSTYQGINGQTPQPASLPMNWAFGSEDCCDNTGNDGLANGVLASIWANTCPIINANFAITNSTFTYTKQSSIFTALALDEMDLRVAVQDCNSHLSWQHTPNQNIARYDIMRKETSASNYTKVGALKAAANATAEHRYSFVDKNNDKANNAYNYQVRIIDHQEQIMLSPVKTVVLDCSGKSPVASLYPNPATENIHLLYDNQTSSQAVRISVLDVAGRVLYNAVKDITTSFNEFTFDVSAYPAGYYLMKYEDVDGNNSGTMKFTIK